MKKAAFLLATLLLFGFNAFAQMHITTLLREDFEWNEATQKWVLTPTPNDRERTVFDFDDNLAKFKHTTTAKTLNYSVINRTVNQVAKVIEMEVANDDGNKYQVTLDPKGKNIRFISRKDGKMSMVRHTIKKIWRDE